MRLESGRDPLHDEAIKHHEQNEKDYDKAMKENKDGINLVSGDNTKKKDGKVKSSQLKKMHLSEDLFVDMFESLTDTDKYDLDVLDKLKNFSPQPNKDKLYDLLDRQIIDKNWLIEELISVISDDQAKAVIRDVDYDENLDESVKYDLYNPDTWELNEALGKDDLRSDIYNALADVMFKYRNNKNITQTDVEQAIEWFIIHFYEFGLDESVDLDEGEDFLDKVAKKVIGESLEEKKTLNEENDLQSGYDIANIIQQNYPKGVDIYNVVDDGPYYTVEFEIDDGDWKHEHLAFKYWMEQNAAELTDCDVKFGGSETLGDSDSDTYSATHTYYFIPNEPYNEEPSDTEDSEEQDIESNNDEISDVPEGGDEIGFDDDSIEMEESLKFNVAREQLKRFNENKMPSNWSPQVYLERLVKRNHITESQKKLLEETYLVK